MSVCRYCRKDLPSVRMIKYASRHWAHYKCWLDSRWEEWLEKPVHEVVGNNLAAWEIRNFPVLVMADWMERHEDLMERDGQRGSALEVLEKALRIAEKRESAVRV